MTEGRRMKGLSADTLHKALRQRHAKDLIVNECKNGPTYSTKQLRSLDAWVLLSTWSPVTMVGYEIKVSRSDWRADTKIDEYLGLCHLFYIVAPKGLVPLNELPAGVGLIEAVGDGTRLVTRKKASRRHIEMPVSLLLYVLMSRVHVKGEREYAADARGSRLDQLHAWALDEHAKLTVGHLVHRKIATLLNAQEARNQDLQRRCENLAQIEQRIIELGFDPQSHVGSWTIDRRLKELTGVIDETGVLSALQSAETAVKHTRAILEAKRAEAAMA